MIYKDIDYSKFRPNIDIEKAIEILNWTMFGYGEKGLKQIETFENTSEFGDLYMKEWKIYADILKYSFYKQMWQHQLINGDNPTFRTYQIEYEF